MKNEQKKNPHTKQVFCGFLPSPVPLDDDEKVSAAASSSAPHLHKIPIILYSFPVRGWGKVMEKSCSPAVCECVCLPPAASPSSSS